MVERGENQFNDGAFAMNWRPATKAMNMSLVNIYGASDLVDLKVRLENLFTEDDVPEHIGGSTPPAYNTQDTTQEASAAIEAALPGASESKRSELETALASEGLIRNNRLTNAGRQFLEAYKKMLKQNAVIVMSADSELLKYLNGASPAKTKESGSGK